MEQKMAGVSGKKFSAIAEVSLKKKKRTQQRCSSGKDVWNISENDILEMMSRTPRYIL